MRRINGNIIIILVMFLGVLLISYPSFSDAWNTQHTSQVISTSAKEIEEMDEETVDHILQDAHAYNDNMKNTKSRFMPKDEEHELYMSLLDPSETGMMASIEIPKINVNLPIYHGTSDDVLKNGVGHLEGSSLPVGGERTHTLLSAHCGWPTARLFTDLDQLEIGDRFQITTMKDLLTYEVDQIKVVTPDCVDYFDLYEGKDYCTLITCTPYGVNTHRLLVRGHRIELTPEEDKQEFHNTYFVTLAYASASAFAGLVIIFTAVGYALNKIPRNRAKKMAEKAQNSKKGDQNQ